MVSVLVCGITQADVSMHFTSCILRMQAELARTPHAFVDFEFFRSVNDALTYFQKETRFDVLVVVDGQTSVDAEFLLRHDPTKDFVIASYPLRDIDWGRVKEKMVDNKIGEPITSIGITYNYEPESAAPEAGGTYVKLPPNADVQLKIFKITRKVLNSILEKHPLVILHTDGILDGKPIPADQRFVQLWGECVYADITTKTKNVGPYDFSGIAGNRKKIR